MVHPARSINEKGSNGFRDGTKGEGTGIDGIRSAVKKKRSKDAWIRHYGEWVLFRLVMLFLNFFSVEQARRLGGGLGRLHRKLDGRHRRVAENNLRAAFAEWTPDQVLKVSEACFRQFGASTLDYVASSRLDRETFLGLCRVEGREHLEAVSEGDRGVLIMSAHLGRWEAAASWLAAAGYPMTVIARPLDNPYLENEVDRVRGRFGNEFTPKRGSMRKALQVLRARGRVGILIDQRVKEEEGGLYPFFGRLAVTSEALAKLSLRTGAPVLPLYASEGERGSYDVKLRPAIYPQEDSTVQSLTTAYLANVEEEIKLNPASWLWLHDRWKRVGAVGS